MGYDLLKATGASIAEFENNLKGKKTTTAEKIATQAQRMLDALKECKTPADLDKASKAMGSQCWWGTVARADSKNGGKVRRGVTIKFGNKVAKAIVTETISVENTVAGVTKFCQAILDDAKSGKMKDAVAAENKARGITE